MMRETVCAVFSVSDCFLCQCAARSSNPKHPSRVVEMVVPAVSGSDGPGPLPSNLWSRMTADEYVDLPPCARVRGIQRTGYSHTHDCISGLRYCTVQFMPCASSSFLDILRFSSDLLT